MNKSIFAVVSTVVLLFVSSRVRANDLTGIWSLGGVVGPAFPIGTQSAKDAGSTGPGVGGTLRYGVSRHLAAVFAYDYLDVGFRAEALTLSGIFYITPEAAASPFIDFGLGLGKRYSGDSRNKLVLKTGLGIERYIADDVSISPVVHYLYMNGGGSFIQHLHLLEPAMWVNYHFGVVNKHA